MVSLIRLAAFVGSAALAIGCGATEPDPTETPRRRLDLRAATGQADALPAGVAVDPTGARFVLDEGAGLYRVTAADALTLVLPLAELPDPGVVVRPPYTDLVAVGPGQFALTAIGDGYRLDLAAHTMVRYFCYLPDGLPEEYDQRTDAVTYDPIAERLYAQPRTVDATGALVRSELAEYLGATGADLAWHPVGGDVAAGGMAMVPGVGLVVGDGTALLRFDGTNLIALDDLARFGVAAIAGLAIDPAANTLLVVDNTTDELIEIDLADLAR